jgi:molecular chaperone HtpG
MKKNRAKKPSLPYKPKWTIINKQRNDLRKSHEGKKDEEIPTAEKDQLKELDNHWAELKSKKEAIYGDYATTNKVIRQLIDLALLQNGMLKGEALNNFVKRSVELI